MVTEIFSASVEDIGYTEEVMEINSPLEAYLNQIRNLLFGTVGTVFGASDMPVDLEQYVFSLSVSPQEIERLIYQRIQDYATLSKNFPTTVNVRVQRGDLRPIVTIDFVIEGIRRLGLQIR